jgi:inositol 1,4,5-triphosphate receptor type 1
MELGVDGLAPDNDDALGVKIATLVLITLCGFVLVLWTIVRYKLNMREKEAEF